MAKEVKEVKGEEPWRQDGLRFVVALQDVVDTSLYKDFFETEKFAEAKQTADDAAEKHQRSVLVFDRKNIEYYKKVIETKKETEAPKPEAPRRGRKKAAPKIQRKGEIPEVKKPKNNNDFFE